MENNGNIAPRELQKWIAKEFTKLRSDLRSEMKEGFVKVNKQITAKEKITTECFIKVNNRIEELKEENKLIKTNMVGLMD